MRIITFCVCLLVAAFVRPALADENPKADEFKRLPREELTKLEGTWELTVDSKTGWKGVLRATITLYDAKGKNADFGNILYDYDARRGEEFTNVKNAPAGGVDFAGAAQGKRSFLVAAQLSNRDKEAVVFRKDRIAPFTLDGDKLTLNASESIQAFFNRGIEQLKLDWAKLEFKRVNAK